MHQARQLQRESPGNTFMPVTKTRSKTSSPLIDQPPRTDTPTVVPQAMALSGYLPRWTWRVLRPFLGDQGRPVGAAKAPQAPWVGDPAAAMPLLRPAGLAARSGRTTVAPSGTTLGWPVEVPTLTRVATSACAPACAPAVSGSRISRSTSTSTAAQAQPDGTPAHTGVIRRVVIVGNGVAGVTAAEQVRRHHPSCRIDLVTCDREPAYNRKAVAALLTRRFGMQGLNLKSDAWYAEHHIHCRLDQRVTGLDTSRQIVTLAGGDALGYDRLIIATGAQAAVPQIDGFAAAGCFVLRQAEDALAIRAHLQRHEVHHVTVVGAGLLGLEVASALRDLDLHVTVLSETERVLEGHIDAAASEMVCEHLRAMKIKLLTNARMSRVQRNLRGCVRRLHLADGRRIGCELVVACVGTQADLALAQLGGLATGSGIIVDAQMRSSVPNVYAAGDVAEFEGQAPGRWGVATDQARVAALSALGLPATYVANAPLTALKVPGIVVRCAGQAEARGDHQRELVLPPALPDHDDVAAAGAPAGYAKLVIEGRRVVGAVFVGDDRHADKLLRAASRRAELASVRDVLARRGKVAAPASLLPLADEERRAA